MHMISLWSTFYRKYGETTSITRINMDCCLELRSAITYYFRMTFLTKEVLLGRMSMIEYKRTFLGKKCINRKEKRLAPCGSKIVFPINGSHNEVQSLRLIYSLKLHVETPYSYCMSPQQGFSTHKNFYMWY